MENLAVTSGSRLLKALGNEKRMEILYNLLAKELNVGELEKIVWLSQSALSQHLAILRDENIVKTRRAAQTIYYSIKSDKVIKILNFIDKLYNNPYKTAM